jgi:hypothetical protein
MGTKKGTNMSLKEKIQEAHLTVAGLQRLQDF